MSDLAPYALLAVGISLALRMVLHVWLQRPQSPYPRGPLPAEIIRPPAGGCGVHGCANGRQHSHVDALAERLRETPSSDKEGQ